MRAIRELIAKVPDLGERNFAPFKTNDLTGETTSHYEIDRRGFTVLAMGFTGEKRTYSGGESFLTRKKAPPRICRKRGRSPTGRLYERAHRCRYGRPGAAFKRTPAFRPRRSGRPTPGRGQPGAGPCPTARGVRRPLLRAPSI